MLNIPQYWAQSHGWTTTFSKESKRPVASPSSGMQQPALADLPAETLENSNIGFITSLDNDIIVIDIDDEIDVASLPEPLPTLIHSTYTEYSLSGTGLHVVARLTDEKKHKILKAAKDAGWEGQVAISNNFMVVTGNKYEFSPNTLAQVSLETLFPLVRLPKQATDLKIQQSQEEKVRLKDLEAALDRLPLDKGIRVKRAWERVTGEEYNHYTFWTSIGMALHDESARLGSLAEGLLLFTKWSRTDPEAYVSDDDVTQHWMSFGNSGTSPITARTLIALSRQTEHMWPEVNSKGRPDPNSWANFKYLLDYHRLKLYYLRGIGAFVKSKDDTTVIDRFFTFENTTDILGFRGPISQSQLQTAVWTFIQSEGIRSSLAAKQLATAWRDQATKVNLVAEWLNTKPRDLPADWREADNVDKPGARETSTIDYLMSCIEFPTTDPQEMELIREQIYRTFMQVLKLADPAHCKEDNGGFLAFIGPEACRKTSFFKWIMPPQLKSLNRILLTPLKGEKSVRDFVRVLAGAAVVLLDECDAFLNESSVGSMLKSVISGNELSMTDIYGTEEVQQDRSAIVVGTSNEMRMKLSDNGNRRFWYVEVRYIHMERIVANMSRYWLFQNLKKEYKAAVERGEKPWLMDEKYHIQITNKNRQFNAESSAEIDLMEQFSFVQRRTPMTTEQLADLVGNPHTNENLMRMSSIRKLLYLKTGERYKASELRRAISAVAVAYAGGLRGTVSWEGKNGGTITWINGEVIYSQGKQKKWLLPPVVDDDDE